MHNYISWTLNYSFWIFLYSEREFMPLHWIIFNENISRKCENVSRIYVEHVNSMLKKVHTYLILCKFFLVYNYNSLDNKLYTVIFYTFLVLSPQFGKPFVESAFLVIGMNKKPKKKHCQVGYPKKLIFLCSLGFDSLPVKHWEKI